jgi:predicted kinase
MGIPASGKSFFYKEKFFNSHVRISMDLLKTRKREDQFLKLCLDTNSRFVVDNTNPTLEERAKYIKLAKDKKYRVIGYFFATTVSAALERNKQRSGKNRIPDVGVVSCYKKLVLPLFAEGFDELFYVQLQQQEFVVRAWQDDVAPA